MMAMSMSTLGSRYMLRGCGLRASEVVSESFTLLDHVINKLFWMQRIYRDSIV